MTLLTRSETLPLAKCRATAQDSTRKRDCTEQIHGRQRLDICQTIAHLAHPCSWKSRTRFARACTKNAYSLNPQCLHTRYSRDSGQAYIRTSVQIKLSMYLQQGFGTWLFARAKRANATQSTATRIANGILAQVTTEGQLFRIEDAGQ